MNRLLLPAGSFCNSTCTLPVCTFAQIATSPLTMPQRSLLAYAGITQARLIPQLEVAANRVVDVGGVYFFR